MKTVIILIHDVTPQFRKEIEVILDRGFSTFQALENIFHLLRYIQDWAFLLRGLVLRLERWLKLIGLFTKFIGRFNKFIEAFNKFIEAFNKFIEAFDKFIEAFNKLVRVH